MNGIPVRISVYGSAGHRPWHRLIAFAASDGDLLSRVQNQVSGYLEQFSEVKCTEKVNQEKLTSNGKVELHRDSTYDYLVILTNAGGEVSLDESRLAIGETAKTDKKNRSAACEQWFRNFVSHFPSLLRRELQVRARRR